MSEGNSGMRERDTEEKGVKAVTGITLTHPSQVST